VLQCAIVGLLAVAACGRLGFDLLGPPGDDSAGDGGLPGDGSMSIIDAPMIDAAPTACEQAIAVGLGRTVPTSTCTFPDRLDGCVGAARQEVVFRFVASTSGGHTIAAFDPGTSNASNSTQIVDGTTCMPISGCSGILGRAFAAGQIVYFMVEASAAPCTMIELEITSP
jgi:hypothetical protein